MDKNAETRQTEYNQLKAAMIFSVHIHIEMSFTDQLQLWKTGSPIILDFPQASCTLFLTITLMKNCNQLQLQVTFVVQRHKGYCCGSLDKCSYFS